MLSKQTIAYLIILFLILAGLSLTGNIEYTPPRRPMRSTTDPEYQQEWRESLERNLERGAYPPGLPLPGGGTLGNPSSIVPDK